MHGFRVEYYGEVSSTQDVVKLRALRGELADLVVVAASQSEGRGRLKREWVSEGGLSLSVLLRPKVEQALWPRLGFAAAASVIRALAPEEEVFYKWPNDVVVAAKSVGPLGFFRKVGGILLEAEGDVLVMGLGVNSEGAKWPMALDERAAKVGLHKTEMLSRFLKSFAEERAREFAETLFFLEERSVLKDVRVKTVDGEGVVCGLSASGALRVCGDDGEEFEVISGEVVRV